MQSTKNVCSGISTPMVVHYISLNAKCVFGKFRHYSNYLINYGLDSLTWILRFQSWCLFTIVYIYTSRNVFYLYPFVSKG